MFAAFLLFASGLTGAVISWGHERDEWLNQLCSLLQPLPALELASRLEAAIMRLTRQGFGLLGLIKSGNVF